MKMPNKRPDIVTETYNRAGLVLIELTKKFMKAIDRIKILK